MQSIKASSCTHVDAGPMEEWHKFRFRRPDIAVIPKFFLKEKLDLTSMEVSLNMLPPGVGMSFTHRHQENEEVYIFLSGVGEFQADGQLTPIRGGSCFRCAPEVSRSWRNTGAEPLVFVVIQAKANSYGPGSTVEDGRLAEDTVLWGSD